MSTRRPRARRAESVPALTITYDVDPGKPAEQIHAVRAQQGNVRATLERVSLVSGSQPSEWLVELYCDAEDGCAREHGELGQLTLAEVLALSETFGAVLAEARRRGFLPAVARESEG